MACHVRLGEGDVRNETACHVPTKPSLPLAKTFQTSTTRDVGVYFGRLLFSSQSFKAILPVGSKLKFMFRFAPVLLLLAMSPVVLTSTQAAPATDGNVKAGTTITDIEGKKHALADKSQVATVLVFTAHDCPISNFYAPEINRLSAEYGPRKVRFFVVYAEDLSIAGARQHAQGFGYRVPLVRDPGFRLSHALGATVTPEAIVLAPDGRRLYRGRIDNRYADFGKKRVRATRRDLREALDAIVKGEPVPHSTTTAVGCFIPDAPK